MPMDDNKWKEAREYDPKKMKIALKALEEVLAGKEVIKAIQENPIPTGGYIANIIWSQYIENL